MRVILIVLVGVVCASLFLYPASEVYACTLLPPTPAPTNTPDASGHIEPLPTNTPYPTPMSTEQWFASQEDVADVIVAGTVTDYTNSTLRIIADQYYKGMDSAEITIDYYFNPCFDYYLPQANDKIVVFLQKTSDNQLTALQVYQDSTAVTTGLINLTGAPRSAPHTQPIPLVMIGFVMSVLGVLIVIWQKLFG